MTVKIWEVSDFKKGDSKMDLKLDRVFDMSLEVELEAVFFDRECLRSEFGRRLESVVGLQELVKICYMRVATWRVINPGSISEDLQKSR